MKNRLHFLLLALPIMIFLSQTVIASDSLANLSKNQKIIFDSIMSYSDQIQILTNDIEILKNAPIKKDGENIPADLFKYLPILVGIISLLFAMFLPFAYLEINRLLKDSKTITSDSKKDIAEIKNETKEFLSNIKMETKNLLDQNELIIKAKIAEIDYMINQLNATMEREFNVMQEKSKEVFQISNELATHRTYLYQNIELLFDIIIWYANETKNKKLLELIFLKRSVSNLYSFNERERFCGILTLGQIGTLSEINHLEHVILDKLENDINKLLANHSIVNIRVQSK